MDYFPDYFDSSPTKDISTSSSPSIMESIHSPSIIMTVNQQMCSNPENKNNNMLDIALTSGFSDLSVNKYTKNDRRNGSSSFLLLNENEQLKVSSVEEFLRLLRCGETSQVKVISIVGNTGDGKSHTLNQCFFDGAEVFSTSDNQEICTAGIWAAFDPRLNVLCLDTEGLLGSSTNRNQQTRLLLKVLAISDVIIYRTRSERLHNDLFTFLGTASKSYAQHFHSALQILSQKADINTTLSVFGPAVIIFHETRNSSVLKSTKNMSPESQIRSHFERLHLDMNAFSSLKYIGVQTAIPPTNFKDLRDAISSELQKNDIRSPRSPQIVYLILKLLNEKFSGEIENPCYDVMFPDQYFTCSVKCVACDLRCTRSMGHSNDKIPHYNIKKCNYSSQHENRVNLCRACNRNGVEQTVTQEQTMSSDSSWAAITKYAWPEYAIKCQLHGIIHKSCRFFYSNEEIESPAVISEIRHVWPGDSPGKQSLQNPAQRVLDSVSYLSEAVSSISSEPSKYFSSWVADKIAPKYWEPNAEIKSCAVCNITFSHIISKHHCRACGKGVCESCSTSTRPVPERGWFSPVRVCDRCDISRSATSNDHCSESSESDDAEIRVRKVGEVFVNTISSVASMFEYPKALIKDTARPSYWKSDSDIKHCCVCKSLFGSPQGSRLLGLHHCRDCGDGVCSPCSATRSPVPHRGWANPVRVCDNCVKLHTHNAL